MNVVLLCLYDDDPDLAMKSFTISSQMTDHAKLSNQLPWYLMCSCCDDVTGSQASGVIGCTCCRLEGHLKDSSARAAHLTAKLTASEADLKQGAVSFRYQPDQLHVCQPWLLLVQQLASAHLRHCAAAVQAVWRATYM